MREFIIFDLEWNQSQTREETLPHLPFEIIEIGAVKLNERREPVSEFHRLIRPVAYRQMHAIIAEVTHMSMKELRRNGLPFSQVMEEFFAWCGEEPVFCTWGNMDLTELQRNLAYHGLAFPYPRPVLYYDVQKLYSRQFSDGRTRESLDKAAGELSLSCKTPFHRALEDARYTGKIFARLDFELARPYRSVDYYCAPDNREDGLLLEFPEYSKFVSHSFSSKEDAMADKTVTDVVCFCCHRMLRKKIRWFSYAQRYYLCLAVCPEHGYVRAKIRIKKTDNGTVFAVRTERFVDEEGAAQVAERKEETKKRRIEHMHQRRRED